MTEELELELLSQAQMKTSEICKIANIKEFLVEPDKDQNGVYTIEAQLIYDSVSKQMHRTFKKLWGDDH